MKALVWLGYLKNNSVRILDPSIWVNKYRESFSMFFFCKYVVFSGEYFNSYITFQSRLKAWETF